jgi:membrane protease YdiL (CAAX protease family)
MTLQTSSSQLTFRSKFLLVLKALLTGFIVTFSGITLWTLDFTYMPMPWSLLLMLFILWLYLKYFSGSWYPKKTREIRRTNFRAIHLPSPLLKWSLVAALLFVILFESGFVITFRIIPFPETAFKSQYKILNTLPVWLGWAAVIVSSLVAGICEETGFRGYMQVPLEKKFGFTFAIIFSSLFFFLVHLSKTWAPSIMPHIFIGGFLLGLLAYRSGSLIPGFIAHTIMDICNFSYWWTSIAGNFEKKTVFITGVDAHFIIWCLVFISAVFLFFCTTNKINKIRLQQIK